VYEASRSRTYNVPVGRLYLAFKRARTRNRWLPGVTLTVRKATADRSIQITWEGETSVEVWFVKKGDSKSTAQVTHRKLASREEISARKVYWGERFQVLGEILA
jgi:hypothetical protein